MFDPHPVAWTSEKIERHWDYIAKQARAPYYSSILSSSLADVVLRASPGGPVVDIGCGRGDLVAELARRGADVVGLDGSEESIRIASARVPGVRFEVAAGNRLPLEDGSAACALLIEVVEHLDDAALSATLEEVRRILPLGGILVLTTPNDEDLHAAVVQCPDCGAQFHPMQHVRSWTASTLSATLRQHRFAPSVRQTRLVDNGTAFERLARRVAYRVMRLKPHLVVIARAT